MGDELEAKMVEVAQNFALHIVTEVTPLEAPEHPTTKDAKQLLTRLTNLFDQAYKAISQTVSKTTF